MSPQITWTPEELQTFDRLIDENESKNQLVRIKARLAIRTFTGLHGEEKCDAMWEHLEAERKKKKGKRR